MKEMFYCGIYYTVTQKQKLLFAKTRLLYVVTVAQLSCCNDDMTFFCCWYEVKGDGEMYTHMISCVIKIFRVYYCKCYAPIEIIVDRIRTHHLQYIITCK